MNPSLLSPSASDKQPQARTAAKAPGCSRLEPCIRLGPVPHTAGHLSGTGQLCAHQPGPPETRGTAMPGGVHTRHSLAQGGLGGRAGSRRRRRTLGSRSP